jgi:two-component system response regulator
MCTVLLVEDNPGDVGLVHAALQELALPVQLHVVSDGLAALAFLHRAAPYADAPRPDLIVLDLNLPVKPGLEVIAAVKQEPDLKLIPIVILTTSSQPEDIRASYERGATAYLQKPLELAPYLARVKTLLSFWCDHVILPPF